MATKANYGVVNGNATGMPKGKQQGGGKIMNGTPPSKGNSLPKGGKSTPKGMGYANRGNR